MLFSFLLRLAMVALTMAIVCWIGWTVPDTQEIHTLQAQGLVEADKALAPSVRSPTPQPPVVLVPPRRSKEARPSLPAALDVNLATEDDFQRLPGIGPVLARRIVEYRETRGTFAGVEQLRHVKGIGKKTFERIRGLVAVGPPAAGPARKAA